MAEGGALSSSRQIALAPSSGATRMSSALRDGRRAIASGVELRPTIPVVVRVRLRTDTTVAQILQCDESGQSVVVREDPTLFASETDAMRFRYRFSFDRVADEDISQSLFYERVVRPIIQRTFLQGRPVTVFAYGASGSGKTYTLEGLPRPDQRGLIIRTAADVFYHNQNASSQYRKLVVRMSSLLLRADGGIVDLLVRIPSTKLKMREEPDVGVFVDNLSEPFVTSVQEVEDLLHRANAARSQVARLTSTTFAASHAIVILHVDEVEFSEDSAPSSTHRSSPIYNPAKDPPIHEFCRLLRSYRANFVDLASSDRTRIPKLLQTSLAKSFNGLAAVIMNTNHKAHHIPFRDSKITYLLRNSLSDPGGRCLFVACVAPTHDSYGETIATLRFAARIKRPDDGRGGALITEWQEGTTEEPDDTIPQDNRDDVIELWRLYSSCIHTLSSAADINGIMSDFPGKEELHSIENEMVTLQHALVADESAREILRMRLLNLWANQSPPPLSLHQQVQTEDEYAPDKCTQLDIRISTELAGIRRDMLRARQGHRPLEGNEMTEHVSRDVPIPLDEGPMGRTYGEIRALKKDLRNLKNELESCEQQRDALWRQYDDDREAAEQMKCRRAEQEADLARALTESTDLKKKEERDRSLLETLQSDNTKLHAELRRMANELEEAHQETQFDRQAILRLTELNKALKIRCQNLESDEYDDKVDILHRLRESEAIRTELEQQVEALTRDPCEEDVRDTVIRQVVEELERARRERDLLLEDVNRERRKLHATIEDLRDENQTLKVDCAQKDASLHTLQIEHRMCTSEFARAKEREEDLQTRLIQLEEDLQKYEEAELPTQRALAEKEDLQERVTDLEHEVCRLQNTQTTRTQQERTEANHDVEGRVLDLEEELRVTLHELQATEGLLKATQDEKHDECTRLQEELAALKAETHEMAASRRTKTLELVEQEAAMERSLMDLEASRNDAAQAAKRENELRKALTTMKETFYQLQEESEVLQEKYTQASGERDALRVSTERLGNERQEMEEKNKETWDLLNKAHIRLQRLEKERESLERTLTRTSEEKEQLQARISAGESKQTEATTLLAAMREERDELQAERRRVDGRRAELELEVNSLKEAAERLKGRDALLQKIVRYIKDLLGDSCDMPLYEWEDEITQDLVRLAETHKELLGRESKHQKTLDTLEREKEDLRERNRMLSGEARVAAATIEELERVQDEARLMMEESSALFRANKALEDALRQEEEETECKTALLAQLRADFKRVAEEKERLRMAQMDVQMRVEQLTEEREDALRQTERQQGQLQSMQKEKEALRGELITMESLERMRQRELNTTRERSEQLQGELTRAQSLNEETEDHLQAARTETASVRQELQAMAKTLHLVTREREDLASQLQSLTQEVEQGKSMGDCAREALQQVANKLQEAKEENVSRRERVLSLEAKVAGYEQELEWCKKDHLELVEQLSQKDVEHEALVDFFEEERQGFIWHINTLQSEREQYLQRIEGHETSTETTHKEVSRLLQIADGARRELLTAQKQRDEAQKEIASIRSDVSSLQAKHQRTQEQLVAIRRDWKKAVEEKERVCEELDTLQPKLQNMDKWLHASCETMQRLCSQVATLIEDKTFLLNSFATLEQIRAHGETPSTTGPVDLEHIRHEIDTSRAVLAEHEATMTSLEAQLQLSSLAPCV